MDRNPGCMAFLRRLEEHATARSQCGRVPDHARECQPCGKRLEFAVGLAAALRQRPSPPAELASGAFLESIHAHAAEALAAGPVGKCLSVAMRVEPLGDRLPWPLQSTVVAFETLAEPTAAPGWLNSRVRARIARSTGAAGGVGRTQFSVPRAAAIAASLAVFALLGWKLGAGDGTSSDPQIVFVEVAGVPPVFYPMAVLRHGTVR